MQNSELIHESLDLEIDLLPARDTLNGITINVNPTIGVAVGLGLALQIMSTGSSNSATVIQILNIHNFF